MPAPKWGPLTYVNGNPLNMWDPDGHDPCSGKYAHDCSMNEDGQMIVDEPGPQTTGTGFSEAMRQARLAEWRESGAPKPNPYDVVRTTSSAGEEKVGLVQNQEYIDLFGWREDKPALLGTFCSNNVEVYVSTGSSLRVNKCMRAGPKSLTRRMNRLVNEDADGESSDRVEDALLLAAGTAAYKEVALSVAAAGTEEASTVARLLDASKAAEGVGKLIESLDLGWYAVKQLRDDSLTGYQRTYNIAGNTVSSIGGGWAAARLIGCAHPLARAGCAVASFAGGYWAGEAFQDNLAANGSEQTIYKAVGYTPPTVQCKPVVLAASAARFELSCGR